MEKIVKPHTHEMRISCKDSAKTLRFAGLDAHMLWGELFDSCTLLNNEREPVRTHESGVLVGTLSLPKVDWSTVMKIIEENTLFGGGKTINALHEKDTVSTIN